MIKMIFPILLAGVVLLDTKPINTVEKEQDPLPFMYEYEPLEETNVDEDGEKEDVTIFLGDSRFVAMQSAVVEDPKDIWIAKVGAGHTWFKDTAITLLKEELSHHEDAHISVVFNLGVNDLGSYENYIKTTNDFVEQYEDFDFYYLSINPVGKTSVTNKQIEKFNKELKDRLDEGIKWIDSYSYLVKNGFLSPDGLHYQNSTSKVIYEYILQSVKEEEDEE